MTRWFSADVALHLGHPAVVELAPDVQARLARWSLARYLAATVHLETEVVTPVVRAIAEGRGPLRLGGRERDEAARLAMDEERHGREAAALAARLELPEAVHVPRFCRELAALGARVGEPEWVALWFVVVSETAISRAMSTLARDPDLHPEVVAFVAEHARDELWHGAWFARRAGEAWACASPTRRAEIAALLPSLIEAYLAPDLEVARADCAREGIPGRVVDEAWSASRCRALLAEGSRSTCSGLARAGLPDLTGMVS